MTNKEMSQFTHAELSQFTNVELQLKTFEEIADSLTRAELIIPTDASDKLTSLIQRLLPEYSGQLITLPDVIHVGRLLLNAYSKHDENLADFNLLFSIFDELIQYFSHKNH